MIVRCLYKICDERAALVELAVFIVHADRANGVHAPVHKCGQERECPSLVDAPLRTGCARVVDVPTGVCGGDMGIRRIIRFQILHLPRRSGCSKDVCKFIFNKIISYRNSTARCIGISYCNCRICRRHTQKECRRIWVRYINGVVVGVGNLCPGICIPYNSDTSHTNLRLAVRTVNRCICRMPNKSSVCRRLAIDLRAFYVDVVEMRIARISHNAARIDAARRTARNRTTNHADIINGCTIQHAEKSGIVNTGNVDVLDAEEIAVELARKCAVSNATNRIATNRNMGIILKVDIILEHIIAREIRCVDGSKFFFRTDQLIVVVCRRCNCAVDLIVRRCGHTAALISDMGIAAVCRIRMKYNRTRCRVHVCRIKEADVLAVHLDRIRRNVLAHIDDIGETCRRIERRYIVRHICSGVYRGDRLRRDMEMPDVDLGILAEDHAVRIDDIDVVAALNLTVDVRGVRTRDNVQIVVGIRDIVRD